MPGHRRNCRIAVRTAVAAICIGCLSWLPALQAEPLTVVGFNVDSGDASDRVIGLQLKQSRGIDLWALGDIWPDGGWVESLHEAAQEAEELDYGVLVGETGGAARLMLLYRSDRLELLGHEELLEAQGSPREAAPLAARMRLAGETELMVVLVHLSDSDRRRDAQSAALAGWLRQQQLPVIALGTFSFGLREGQGPDADMSAFLGASGLQWLRPTVEVTTTCLGGGRVDDFVLVGGGATGWNGRAEVMFPQSNYCPDDERTSSHRPVLARFSPSGGVPDTDAGMAERQALPLLPGELETATDEFSDKDAEIESLRRRVEELEASQTKAPQAAGVTPTTAPAAAPTSPSAAPAASVSAAGPRPATEVQPPPANLSVSDDRAEPEPSTAGLDETAILRRLDALEAEIREVRRLLDGSSD